MDCQASNAVRWGEHLQYDWRQWLTGSRPALQRVLLWERRNNVVAPFDETVQQVFARISALRDSLDGPEVRI